MVVVEVVEEGKGVGRAEREARRRLDVVCGATREEGGDGLRLWL